jgi:hypothetical protein
VAARDSASHDAEFQGSDAIGMSSAVATAKLQSGIMQVEGVWKLAVEALNGHLRSGSAGIRLTAVVTVPRNRSGRHPRKWIVSPLEPLKVRVTT